MKRKTVQAGFIFFILVAGLAAEEVQFSFRLLPEYKMTERADYTKRVNGSYQGFVSREVRGVFHSDEQEPGVFHVEGTWFRAEEMKKQGMLMAMPLDRVEKAEFVQNSLGQTLGNGDYPILRNFPQFPATPIAPGDRWEAPMELVVFDPSSDLTSVLTLYCGYTYQGTDVYKERPVHVIQAQYAVRKKGYDRNMDLIIGDVQGSHQVTLMIDQETMSPILARDSFKETWSYRNGQNVEYKGFNLTFYDGIEGMDRVGMLDSLARSFGDGAILASAAPDPRVTQPSAVDPSENINKPQNPGSEEPPTPSSAASYPLEQEFDESLFDQDVTVYEREEGVALSLNNLHFLPDQAVILSQDYPLLDKIAQVLKNVPQNTLLVKGHTADVGSMESQMVLSQERAKVVVDELSARGIGADRFVYIGMGGTEPVGDNSTDSGRRLNRRVEIVIMED